MIELKPERRVLEVVMMFGHPIGVILERPGGKTEVDVKLFGQLSMMTFLFRSLFGASPSHQSLEN